MVPDNKNLSVPPFIWKFVVYWPFYSLTDNRRCDDPTPLCSFYFLIVENKYCWTKRSMSSCLWIVYLFFFSLSLSLKWDLFKIYIFLNKAFAFYSRETNIRLEYDLIKSFRRTSLINDWTDTCKVLFERGKELKIILVLPRDEDRDKTIVGRVIEQIGSRDSEEPALPLVSSNTGDDFSNSRLELEIN